MIARRFVDDILRFDDWTAQVETNQARQNMAAICDTIINITICLLSDRRLSDDGGATRNFYRIAAQQAKYPSWCPGICTHEGPSENKVCNHLLGSEIPCPISSYTMNGIRPLSRVGVVPERRHFGNVRNLDNGFKTCELAATVPFLVPA